MSLPNPEAVRVVCLDWGGVLLRICRSWEQACQAAGLPMPAEPIDPAVRARRRALSEAYQLGRLDCEAYFRAVADLSPGYSPKDVQALHDAYLIAEYPGARALAEQIAGHGRLRGALLSNTNARHWMRRSEFTAPDALHVRLASHLEGLAKPDAAFYRALERAVGAAGPQVAFFDDLEDNVQTARRLGWQAVRIDPDGDPVAQVRQALGPALA